MSKSIKKTFTILSFLLATILLFLASVPILLQSDKIQNYVAQKVIKELSQNLGTEISIGKVKFQLLNAIQINDILIKDPEADTLAYIEKAKLNFKLREFFKGKYIFTGIDIQKFKGSIKIDKNGSPNFKFIVDALNKPEKKKSKAGNPDKTRPTVPNIKNKKAKIKKNQRNAHEW